MSIKSSALVKFLRQNRKKNILNNLSSPLLFSSTSYSVLCFLLWCRMHHLVSFGMDLASDWRNRSHFSFLRCSVTALNSSKIFVAKHPLVFEKVAKPLKGNKLLFELCCVQWSVSAYSGGIYWRFRDSQGTGCRESHLSSGHLSRAQGRRSTPCYLSFSIQPPVDAKARESLVGTFYTVRYCICFRLYIASKNQK